MAGPERVEWPGGSGGGKDVADGKKVFQSAMLWFLPVCVVNELPGDLCCGIDVSSCNLFYYVLFLSLARAE